MYSIFMSFAFWNFHQLARWAKYSFPLEFESNEKDYLIFFFELIQFHWIIRRYVTRQRGDNLAFQLMLMSSQHFFHWDNGVVRLSVWWSDERQGKAKKIVVGDKPHDLFFFAQRLCWVSAVIPFDIFVGFSPVSNEFIQIFGNDFTLKFFPMKYFRNWSEPSTQTTCNEKNSLPRCSAICSRRETTQEPQ